MSVKILLIVIFSIAALPVMAYQSLQDIFDQATPYGAYDKYIELDPAIEYLGDLHITGDINTRLIGNGALIHGVNIDIAIGVHTGHADISGCVIVGGGFGIYYSFGASGNIYNNTIYGSSMYGISTIYQDTIDGVHIWDNIITNCYCGILCIEENQPSYYGYNTFWAIQVYNCAEQCLD